MKTYHNLYQKLCSIENLKSAHKKARKGKAKTKSVKQFEKNLEQELRKLQQELINQTYKPKPLRRFSIKDPKTRIIHASAYRDRVVQHALIAVINPIFERRFIHDSYAGRLKKGTHKAVQRFDKFKRKVSRNGRVVGNYQGKRSGNEVEGYVLKADIKHYFDNIDHGILINIIKNKIKDEKVLWLIKQILNSFNSGTEGKGMPLGNYTSQYFANIYLNKLDYFVKHFLKARFYIRYVDDLVILHRRKKTLEYYKKRIARYLKCLQIELHPDKSQIIPLRNGITFLGYRIFYHYRLLRKRNIRSAKKKIEQKLLAFEKGFLDREKLIESLQGWFGYAQWADTYRFRHEAMRRITINEKTQI